MRHVSRHPGPAVHSADGVAFEPIATGAAVLLACWRAHKQRLLRYACAAGTMLVLDGEIIPYEPIFVEIHAGLCSVITCL